MSAVEPQARPPGRDPFPSPHAATRADPPARGQLARAELLALCALCMSLSALGIDTMLPAFGDIRGDLGLAPGSNEVGRVVTTYLLGLAMGQLLYGPLADRFGRKRALTLGICVYSVGVVLSAVAPTFGFLLGGRLLWGIGAAGPRVIATTIVRDVFEGEAMARAMSFVMAIFLLVPILAPSLGAAVVAVASWRWLLLCCGALSLMVLAWSTRLAETLRPQDRLELRVSRLAAAARVVVTTRQTALATLSMMALFGAFSSYLASSEPIFDQTFGQGDRFPLIFGGLASVMGVMMLVNARLVGRLGSLTMVRRALVVGITVSAAQVVVAFATGGRPPLGVFLALMAALLSTQALLIPNLTSLAMAPMGHLAGTASSVTGASQTAGGAIVGALVDLSFNGTITPLAFAFFGAAAVGLTATSAIGRQGRTARVTA